MAVPTLLLLVVEGATPAAALTAAAQDATPLYGRPPAWGGALVPRVSAACVLF
ncbi:MAG TPA: hypothetical protein VK066_17865 [Chloroflexota bacterium]|nr:hypothetical protein [Chloroflexota bacterium]